MHVLYTLMLVTGCAALTTPALAAEADPLEATSTVGLAAMLPAHAQDLFHERREQIAGTVWVSSDGQGIPHRARITLERAQDPAAARQKLVVGIGESLEDPGWQYFGTDVDGRLVQRQCRQTPGWSSVAYAVLSNGVTVSVWMGKASSCDQAVEVVRGLDLDAIEGLAPWDGPRTALPARISTDALATLLPAEIQGAGRSFLHQRSHDPPPDHAAASYLLIDQAGARHVNINAARAPDLGFAKAQFTVGPGESSKSVNTDDVGLLIDGHVVQRSYWPSNGRSNAFVLLDNGVNVDVSVEPASHPDEAVDVLRRVDLDGMEALRP